MGVGRERKRDMKSILFCLQILNNFSLESCNEGEVNLKSELIGIPDKKILISFRRNAMSWKARGERKQQERKMEEENEEKAMKWSLLYLGSSITLLICN